MPSLTRKLIILKGEGNISYNYHFELMKSLYKLMTETDLGLTRKVHDEGIEVDKKKFKLFNYALQFQNVIYGKDNIEINEESVVKLVISGRNDILNLIVKALVKTRYIVLNDTELDFITVEDDQKFRFNNIMLFKVRTPIVESKFDAETGKTRYLSVYDDEYFNTLGQNLLRKYKALYNKDYEGELYFDIEDIFKAKKKYITKIKDNGFVIGYTDFEIFVEADIDMQKVAYYLGLGQNTSIGMGNVTYIMGRRD